MNGDKYIGLDVHQATISVAVLDSAGKLLMESVIETKAATILQFIQGLRGNLYVTFEEGTCAAWLYDLLKPHVTKVVVCDPRKNALLKAGNKSDRIDARKLAELLRSGLLSPVYQGEAEAGLRTLKELARSYLTTAKDLTRVMNRLKALYRSRAIFCAGRRVYAPHHRAEWLQRLPAAGARHRAERLYLQLDLLQVLRQEARRELLAESRKHRATRVLRKIPFLGPVRVALLIALLQTPHRFRTKRQLWAYSGLALETHTSADYRFVAGQLQRSRKLFATRGLNEDHNHELKNIFKGAATTASARPGPFHDFYAALLAKGMRPSMARLTLARKIAAITLTLWKKGERFDAEHLKRQAA
jgi:transposase